ncbi:MAG: hypothetical protein JEZ08_07650 [Clostridiales bacterium]|nr:hypothetical protein [Clostridiales bacterium]
MRKKFERSTKLILILCGLVTAGLGGISISPEFFLEKIFKLDYIQTYDIIIRHWSASVFILGVLLVISAFNEKWRIPLVLFAILEKMYLVVVCIFAMKYTYGKPFAIIIPLDTALCLLLVFVLLNEFGKSKRIKI